jgi:DNA-directed RNA polymerase specialized sigma24 family protein
LAPGDVAEATALYLAGWPLLRLGDHFGCTAETVRQALHRAGVQRRRPPTTAP